MTYLVTGAGGFVGAALCAALCADGQPVVGVVRPGEDNWRIHDPSVLGVEFIRADISSEDFLRTVIDLRPSRVFHLAAHGAYSWQTDARSIVETNLTATVHLADALAKAGGCESFVHTGSSSEYGLKDHAHHERDRVEPNSVYAVAKAAATNYLGHLHRTKSLPAVTARLFSIYGPFEDRSRLIPQVVTLASTGKLPPFASPDIARDFVYIDDAVRCLRSIADAVASGSDTGEIVNVSSGVERTLQDVADSAQAAFPNVSDPVWGTYEARSWDTNKWCGDPTNATERTGWSASVDLRDGLRQFADWIRLDEQRVKYYGG
jgi:nucleoside-diphosphate-sugar epimerase